MGSPLDRSSAPFRGTDAVRAGRTTADRLRGPTFVRLAPDVYAGSGVDPSDPAVRAAAVDRWARGRGVVAGPLAALAHGVDCPWEDAEVVLSPRAGSVPAGLSVRTDRLGPHEVTQIGGVRLTTPERTAFDLARRSVPVVDAVAAVDALGHRYRFGAPALRRLEQEHPGARGLLRLRDVVGLMDPLAESLMESRLRVTLAQRGVPRPVPQLVVWLRGHGEVRLDLAWPEPGPRGRPVALEYDGPEHRTIAGQARDHRRDAALRAAGWVTIRVSSAQVYVPRLTDQLAADIVRTVFP